MQFHEIANIFPIMNEQEFVELKADIQEQGLLEPIVTYEGKILDGRNRFMACNELGIEPVYQQYDGNKPIDYVVGKNLKRRHLNETQRGVIAHKLANMRQGERTDLEPSANLPKVSQEDAAKAMNISGRTLRSVAKVSREAPELIPLMESGKMSAHEAEKKVNTIKKEKELEKLIEIAESTPAQDKWNVFEGDIHNVKLEKNSIDAIITDPPYPQDCLPLWEELGKFAQYHLKVGGVLLAMTGRLYLPQIFEMLGKYLTYQWMLACVLPGQHSEVYAARVNNAMWKPILVYRNGGEPINIGSDLFENDKRDKNYHEWGQGVGGYLWQVEHLTKPNDLICDPFLGGGTTGVAAIKLQRRFVGFDIDANNVAIAKARLNEIS